MKEAMEELPTKMELRSVLRLVPNRNWRALIMGTCRRVLRPHEPAVRYIPGGAGDQGSAEFLVESVAEDWCDQDARNRSSASESTE